MNTTEWLENLKVGDEVYVTGRYGELGQIRKVVRLTKTQILLGEHARFRKNTGTEVGGGAWSTRSIIPVTDDIRASIYESQLRYRLTKQLEQVMKSAPASVLERIEAIVKEYENGQNVATD